jgi:hypothetical protein
MLPWKLRKEKRKKGGGCWWTGARSMPEMAVATVSWRGRAGAGRGHARSISLVQKYLYRNLFKSVEFNTWHNKSRGGIFEIISNFVTSVDLLPDLKNKAVAILWLIETLF